MHKLQHQRTKAPAALTTLTRTTYTACRLPHHCYPSLVSMSRSSRLGTAKVLTRTTVSPKTTTLSFPSLLLYFHLPFSSPRLLRLSWKGDGREKTTTTSTTTRDATMTRVITIHSPLFRYPFLGGITQR